MSTATVFVASSAIAPGIDLKLIGVHAAEAHVLGVRVDCIDMESALKRIEALANAGGHHLVATVNPEFVMRARSDREFARVLESADLCLPDGSGVVWAARRQGCSMSGPVTGVDLIPPLAAMCARRGWRMFLLGAQPVSSGSSAWCGSPGACGGWPCFRSLRGEYCESLELRQLTFGAEC